MAVITINRDHLREVSVDLCAIEQQLNVVTAVCVHTNDDGARLTVGLEETTLADVHDGVSNLGCGNIVERAVAVRVDGLTRGTARVRSAVVRGTTRHRSAWHRNVAPGYGKGKFDDQIL
jgi:hypothetical protein